MIAVEKLLRDLIALPSVNPAFLSERHPHAGEGRVAEFLATVAARAGLNVEFQRVLPHRPNILATLRPSGRIRHRILLAPHLDTVNVVSEEQFRPVRKGDRLFGRGASDTKGSVAAMLGTLCRLAKLKTRPTETEITFSGLVDEESAQAGARALVKSGRRADLAIVGEPTKMEVVTAHKGNVWLQIETRGKSAHGATPQFGKNAVVSMARVVELLEKDYAARLQRRRHPVLGCATISVGTICGGSQANIVPDSCTLTADRRTLPGETEAGIVREVWSLLRRAHVDATVASVKIAPCPSMETNPGLPLVRQFLRAAGQRTTRGVHYFCDAAVLANGGMPAVVFGPGDIAQAHTADEWISLRQVRRASEMLFSFLKSLP